METMLLMLEELQNIKRTEEEQEEQQETQDEALELNRKVETLEGNVKALYSSLLSHEKHCGHNAVTGPNVTGNSRQLRPAAENEETEEHQERLLLVRTKVSSCSVYFTLFLLLSLIFFFCFIGFKETSGE